MIDRRRFVAGVLAFAALCCAPVAHAAEAASAQAEIQPVALTRLAAKLQPGEQWMTLQTGFFCSPKGSLSWGVGQTDQKLQAYLEPFRAELTKAGFKVEGGSEDLFSNTGASNAAAFSVGALVTDERLRVCLPNPTGTTATVGKGEATMNIEWQIYDRLQRRVVAKVETTGHIEIKNPTAAAMPLLLSGAFADNVDRLAASPEFRKAVTTAARAADTLAQPDSQASLALAGSLHAQQRPVRDEPADVIEIFTGDAAMGSGFLISSDGYVLTAAHVVGDAKQVRVHWPDGLDKVGEVVRVSKPRDVALIKTDARGRSPLPLRRELPQVGETVYAIGAPLGKELQGTVTRGVVSANRVFNGYSYVQSDVMVNHGNSGGPLLDEQGRVVGITDLGAQVRGAPLGLNLFTPIPDALDFLTLEQR